MTFHHLEHAIQEGITRRLHTGVQVCIIQNGQILLNRGFGTSDGAIPLTSHALMPWRSAGKPLTALLTLICVDRGCFDLTATLGQLLPEARGTGKSDISLLQILTHTAGLAGIDTGWPHQSWDTSVAKILAAAPVHELDSAAYDPHAGWFLLGEIARRQLGSGAPYAQVLQHEVLEPIGMLETACGDTTTLNPNWWDNLPVIFEREAGKLIVSSHSSGSWLTQESAGAGLRGPAADLALFYECLRNGGRTRDGQQIVAASLIQEMVRPHRYNQYDATLQHRVDFGLGVIVDADHATPETVPYGFGAGSSGACFGHGGAQCAMGFCDPDQHLVVVWATNGFCGEGHHLRRNHALNTAVYHDLGLLS
jgi:CubicO group peptidase (beta-lactamase class C family)